MERKFLIALFAFAILGLFLVYADISSSLSNSQNGAITRSTNTTQLTLTASGNYSITSISVSDVQDFLSNNIHFIVSPTNFPVSLNDSQSAVFNITATNFPSEDDSNLGDLIGNIKIVYSNGTDTFNQTPSLPITLGWCSEGDRGNISIESVKDTTSSTKWKWQPLDKVDVDIKVKNNDKDNDLDITVALDLYDTVDHQFLGLDGNGADVEDTVTVNSKSTETITETVTVPVEALKDSSRYVLYAKAFETEDERCSQQTQNIDLNRNTNKIALTTIKPQNVISCGDTGTVTLNVANIGKNEEKKVQVTVRSPDLGISASKVLSNLATDSSPKAISFSYAIPQNATEKNYTFFLDTAYHYNSNTAAYDLTDEGLDSFNVMVAGGCQATVTTPNVILSSSLQSAANAGQELTVKTTLTNTGNAQATYTLSVSGQDAWSTGLRLSQTQVTLSAGQSQDVLIYLTPNAAVSGNQQFTISATSNGQTKQQNVVVNVAAQSSGFNFNLGNNWYLWLIIGINVILIVIIIIVAISMGRKA